MPHINWYDPRFGEVKIVRSAPTKPFDGDETQPLDPLYDLVDVTDWQRKAAVIDDHNERYALLRERMAARRAAYQPGVVWRAIAAFWRIFNRS